MFRASAGFVSHFTHGHRRTNALCLLVMLFPLVHGVPIHAQQQGSSKDSMAGMDMSGDMKDMGPSMAAMAGHMYVTALRPKQPGDDEKVKALLAQIKASIERYQDYHKARSKIGYVIGNPKVDEHAVSLHQGGQCAGGRAAFRSHEAFVSALFSDADTTLQAGRRDVHGSTASERG